MRTVKFDEIGNVIVREEMTEALFNIAWKVSRPRQVVRDDLTLVNAEPVHNEYLHAARGAVTLTSRSWLPAARLFSDMEIQERALRGSLGQGEYLWPFSCAVQKKSDLRPKFLLRFPEGLFRELYETEFKKSGASYMTFRNQVYMKVLRGFVSARWFLEYLFGATPYDFASGEGEGRCSPKRSAANCLNPVMQKQADGLNYQNLSRYLASSDGTNPDGAMPDGNYEKMVEEGIHFLRIEIPDYNPDSVCGVTPLMISTLELMAGYFLMTEEIDAVSLVEARRFSLAAAQESPYAKSETAARARVFLQELLRFAREFGFAGMQSVSDALKRRTETPENTPAARILRLQGSRTLLEYGRELMRANQSAEAGTAFDRGSERVLEEAVLNGIAYQPVIPGAGIVQIGSRMIGNGIQTSDDSALMKEIWDRKSVAKQFVEQFGFTVLTDYIVKSRRDFDSIFPRVRGLAVAVKHAEEPSDRNATLFRLPPSRDELWTAVSRLLHDGRSAMIELVVPGSVYRALFFQGKILSVIERLPAGVVGDGRRSVRQLVDARNVASPQAAIEIGDIERVTMDVQGITEDTVPGRGSEVLLRYDATEGTGSRSLEVLDEIDASYLAELSRLAQALKLHDGAVDVVIPNIYQKYDEEQPGMFIFLDAHAVPDITLHENTVLQKRNVAREIVMTAAGRNAK